MNSKAVISLTTGLEDAEKVTVAFLVAVGAVETGRDTVMFLTKEAVRVATSRSGRAIACDGCPELSTLLHRYAAAGGKYFVCPICFGSRGLDEQELLENAELNGTIPLWQWIGQDHAVTFSY
jgi:predicted peroxiredoxin